MSNHTTAAQRHNTRMDRIFAKAAELANARAAPIKEDVRAAIVESDGTPFVRPEWTGDKTVYSAGFYWANLDGDRFYFATREQAELDLATDCGD